MNILGSVLVIDSNNEIKSLIWDNLYQDSPDKFIFQQSTISASQIAVDKKKGVSIILISAHLPKLNLEDFIAKLLEDTVGAIPVVLTYKHAIESKLQTKLVAMGIAGVEEMPTTPAQVKSLLKRYLIEMQRFNNISASAEEKDKDFSTKDENMIEIPLNQFVFTPKSFFNVFIKLGKDKFIKILNAGDPISEEFINRYKLKKISGLHLKIEEHDKYLKLSHSYSEISLKNETKNTSEKIDAVSNQIESTSTNMIQLGVSPENITLAKGCVENTRTLINQMMMGAKKKQSFDLIDKILGHDHSTTVSMLAGLFAHTLDIRSAKTVQVVGLAALLHDIGLGLNIKEANREKFTSEEAIKFLKHASVGAEYLRKTSLFDEIICQIVEFHHEQDNPNSMKKSSGALSIASEIVSIADSVATNIMENDNPKKAIKLFRISKLKSYSVAIQKAFDEIFPDPDRDQKR